MASTQPRLKIWNSESPDQWIAACLRATSRPSSPTTVDQRHVHQENTRLSKSQPRATVTEFFFFFFFLFYQGCFSPDS